MTTYIGIYIKAVPKQKVEMVERFTKCPKCGVILKVQHTVSQTFDRMVSSGVLPEACENIAYVPEYMDTDGYEILLFSEENGLEVYKKVDYPFYASTIEELMKEFEEEYEHFLSLIDKEYESIEVCYGTVIYDD